MWAKHPLKSLPKILISTLIPELSPKIDDQNKETDLDVVEKIFDKKFRIKSLEL